MTRLDEIRERHAARLRTRAAKGDGSVQMSTLVDDDAEFLLASVDRVSLILDNVQHEVGTLQVEVERRDKMLDEVRSWAEDEYGDSTDVPTGLAMAIYRSVTP